MSSIDKHAPGFAKPGTDNKDNDEPKRPQSLRDRWESVRYGPVGRVLGYALAFTVVFVLIFLLLWSLEHKYF